MNITKDTLHEWEIRLNSNIYFLDNFIKEKGDIIINTDEEGIENGQPKYLSEIVEDLEDIRQEIENI